jgi:glucans biosynthesis protein
MSVQLGITAPMLASRRCGARTRSGTACRAPAVHGKRRCRMHGGAEGSGAPKGNRNRRWHGGYSGEVIAERRQARALLDEVRKLLEELK